MTSQALKAAATGIATKSDKPKDLFELINNPNTKAQIALALPRHMTADRLARIAMTELRRIPKLQQCDPMSFLGAVMQCSQLGLEPGGALGHVYILPFEKRAKQGNQWVTVSTEAQVIIGYRGMIDLARRSGQIISIEARAVYEGDTFDVTLGLNSNITHKPDWNNPNRDNPAKLIFVYAVAKLKDGGIQFDVMSRSEVEATRARSKAATSGPWVTDYVAMALKTVCRRLFKWLPVSIEVQRAVGLDEQAERGEGQNNASVIDVNMTEVQRYEAPQAEEYAPNPETGEIAAPAATANQPPQKTYAEILDLMLKAKNHEALDVAGDWINTIADPALRTELSQKYDALKAEMTA
jgi:recombination protein RecT